MNLYTNSYNDRLAVPQRRNISYKQILDHKIREKKNQLRQIYTSRFRTQPICPVQLISPRYQSIDIYNKNINKPRKFHQQSVYLPVLNKSQKYQKQKAAFTHQRVHSLGDNSPYHPQETQTQTIQALAECQLIIENLKKLTMSSTRGIKRKINIYDQFKVPSYVPYNNYYSDKNERYKQRQSQASQQVMMFRAYEPSSKYPNSMSKKKSLKKSPQSKSKSKKYNRQDQSQYQDENSRLDKKTKKKNSSNRIQQEDEQRSKIQADEEKDQFQNSTSYIKNLILDKNDQSINTEAARAEQQERKKIQKQKKWLKYLSKARLRGAQLQQKIIQFKQKLLDKQDIQDKDVKEDKSDIKIKQSKKTSKISQSKNGSSNTSPSKMKILSRKLNQKEKTS